MDLQTETDKRSSRVLLAFILASALALGGLASLIVDVVTNVPDFTKLKTSMEVTVKNAKGDKTTRIIGPKTKAWVPISEISNYALMAVIASEDSSFFSHDGVDFHELKEAIKKDWKEKRWARGASTITQQVVKNTFLSREKTLWRKFKEFFWAREMDKVLSKTEILNFYFNLVEWGPGIYGIREASRVYFGVPPSQLTARQGAFLAMLLPSPIKYHTYFKKKQLSEWATGRVNRILQVMAKMGFVEEEVYQAALTERLWNMEGTPFKETFPPGDDPSSDLAEEGESISTSQPGDALESILSDSKPAPLPVADPPGTSPADTALETEAPTTVPNTVEDTPVEN
jgi:monofunctional glycosyltransferase